MEKIPIPSEEEHKVEQQHSKCVSTVGPMLRFNLPTFILLGAIEKLGCELPKPFISCK
jgi:hypothetical protein